MIKRKKLSALLLVIFIGLFFLKKTVYSVNLLTNSGFEEGNLFWRLTKNSINFNIISDDIIEGTRSALIENLSSNYSYGIEQIITNIKSNFNYKIAASIKLQDEQTTAFFRVAWYESNDGSGSQLSTSDSDYASSHREWQRIDTVKKSPAKASSAKVRLLVKNGKAYFDNIVFEEDVSLILPLTPTVTPTFSLTPSPIFYLGETPTPLPILYENIYLSEVMINPVTGEKEWVEIYNDNDFKVELNNWFIDDLENAGSTPKSFILVIDKKSYGVVELSAAIFNNSGDQVRLLDFNKNEKDSFEYSFSEVGKSYGRISFDLDEWCQQEPSLGVKNNPCLTQPTITSITSTSSDLSLSSLNKNSNHSFSISKSDNYSKKRIYKSYQPNLLGLSEQKSSSVGEILGEETRRESQKNDLLFLPLFQFLATNFFFLRKILKSIKVKS